MKITLFEDIKEENWPSMRRYASALLTAMRKPQASIKRFSIPAPRGGLQILPFRFVAYPLLAMFNQGDVNHVLDHSYGHLLYFLDSKKTVVTCHDLIPLKYEKDSWAQRMFKFSVGGLKKAARIIADSKATKNDLLKLLRIPEEKIKVIYLGVSEEFKPPSANGGSNLKPQTAKTKYGIPEGKILLHVGNSLAYKNIEGILKALKQVLARFENVYFIKVGSDLTESQKQLAKTLGVEKNIIELSYVEEADLPVIYNLSDVLVMPSFKEGFGLPVLEALACGCLVVCSNTSSLPEVGGNVALYVNPKDEAEIAKRILEVLNYNTAQYHSRMEKGLAWAKKFTWEKTAKEVFEVYKEIL